MLSLHVNESPFDPAPGVQAALLSAVRGLREYPDPTAISLREALARHHDVDPSCILVGAGGDGILDAVFRTFSGPDQLVLLTDPTYGVLGDLCLHYGAPVITTAWPDVSVSSGLQASLICIVNPNSPTGEWVPPRELERLLPDGGAIVVVDEAYAPFAGESVIPLLSGHPRWVVVRSFSKAYALAGLRVGYMVASPEIVKEVQRAQLPYPVSSVALAAAEAALADSEYLTRLVEHVRVERRYLESSLSAIGWDPGRSEGNFVFARPRAGAAADWKRFFWDSGIAVRWFPDIDPERLRITVSTRESSDRVLNAAASGFVAAVQDDGCVASHCRQ
ncbi:pyridoxal phosphate-dependent aminotransferase [Promicromonospora sp. MS192]|uniref:pyridoxal phosphate-dependent aminotransferase n=1 Tax=Promicromonospora sp. MS192 TaxID=3412684 RepID=UPI003C2C53F0